MGKLITALDNALLVSIVIWFFIVVSMGISGFVPYIPSRDIYDNIKHCIVMNVSFFAVSISFFTWVFWPGKEEEA